MNGETSGDSSACIGLNSSDTPFMGLDRVSTVAELRQFLLRYENQMLKAIDLPAVCCAWRHANLGQLRELLELDQAIAADSRIAAFAEGSRAVGRLQLRQMRSMQGQRMATRYLDAIENEQANGWNPLVYGLFLSMHAVPLREGLFNYGQQLWRGIVRAARNGRGLPEQECKQLLEEFCSRLPGWIAETLADQSGTQDDVLTAVN